MANLFLWGRLDLSGHFAGPHGVRLYSDDDFSPVTVRVRNQMRHSSHEEAGAWEEGSGGSGNGWPNIWVCACVCVQGLATAPSQV